MYRYKEVVKDVSMRKQLTNNNTKGIIRFLLQLITYIIECYELMYGSPIGQNGTGQSLSTTSCDKEQMSGFYTLVTIQRHIMFNSSIFSKIFTKT